MNVLVQALSPGMQYRGHAQLAVQSLWVFGKHFQGLPDALKQQLIEHFRMQLYPAIKFMRQGEYQMIIRHGQDVLLLPVAPLAGGAILALRAVTVSTAMVLLECLLTLVTLILESTHGRGMALLQMAADCQPVKIQPVSQIVIIEMALQDLLQG